ncbi:hypothetical protein B9Z55_007901 [Caenorhabditis nigoni]|uniref:BTB domain-containing protein n=1 Tax=Caenorhabditis nigoni TaxID=1611254 RepID=A0A2G5VBQ6_9PELO|nr:hypothetical protein B9Z55_007901 [Caenorhabditis nigoni]
MTDTVKLDVGGTIFKTTKSTLTKFDGFFRTMFETPIPVPRDESGAIFIDRSPKHFDLILHFMRDGHVDLQKYSEDISEIQKEAEYYMLDGLVELCTPKLCIPKPVPREMPFFFSSDEDMARAISSSTKKIVCSVFYPKNQKDANFEDAVKNIMKYGQKIDFFFKEQEQTDRGLSHYTLFNKTNNKYFEAPSNSGSLDSLIKQAFPDIDNY